MTNAKVQERFGTITGKSTVTSPVSGLKLEFLNTNQKAEYAIFTGDAIKANSNLPQQLKAVVVGDNVKITKQEGSNGYFNPVNLEVVAELPAAKPSLRKFGGSTSSARPYDVSGQIKGNIVTNAVQHAGAGASLQTLQQSAELIFQLHQFVETMDIKGQLTNDSKTTSTPKPVKLDLENLI